MESMKPIKERKLSPPKDQTPVITFGLPTHYIYYSRSLNELADYTRDCNLMYQYTITKFRQGIYLVGCFVNKDC